MSAPIQCKTRQQIWHEYLHEILPKDICAEFGVWQGGSINYMAKVRPDNEFNGFDSFDGLPEPWNGHDTGHFAVSDPHSLKWASNVNIHAGLFEDGLHEFLSREDRPQRLLRHIHIDCDLGSSTATVLEMLSDVITGNPCQLLFDEFYNYRGFEDHEFKAFLDFANAYQLRFRVIARNIMHQQVLIQTP